MLHSFPIGLVAGQRGTIPIAALAAGTALASSCSGRRLRCAAMARFGRTATGLVEDAAVCATGLAVTRLPIPAAAA